MAQLIIKAQKGIAVGNFLKNPYLAPVKKPIYAIPLSRITNDIYRKAVPLPTNTFDNVPLATLNSLGLDKRTNWGNIKTIYNVVKKSGLNKYQNAAILANIIHESFGNPTQQQIGKDGKPISSGYGFFQNTPERTAKMRSTINPANVVAQTKYVVDSLRHGDGKTDWNARGKYTSWIEARDEFNNTNDKDPDALDKYVYSLTTGYVGPKDLEGQYKTRLETAKKLIQYMD